MAQNKGKKQLKQAARPKATKRKAHPIKHPAMKGAKPRKGRVLRPHTPRHAKPTIDDSVIGPDGLTDRRRLFIELFPRYLNGARTARESGYSEKSARQAAYVNMTNADIRARIEERLKPLAMGRAELIARISDIAAGTMEDCISFDRKGRAFIDLKKVKAAGKMHLIQQYRIGVQGISVKLYSALEAQEKLAKILKMYDEVGDKDRPMHLKVDQAVTHIYIPDNGRDSAETPPGGDSPASGATDTVSSQ